MEVNDVCDLDFFRKSQHYMLTSLSSSGASTQHLSTDRQQHTDNCILTNYHSEDSVAYDTMYIEQIRKPTCDLKLEYYPTENQIDCASSNLPELQSGVCNNASVFSANSSDDYQSTVGNQENPGDNCDTLFSKILTQKQSAKLSEALFVRALIGRCKRIAPLWFRGVSSMRERNREENRRMANNNGQSQSDWRAIALKIEEMDSISETDAVANLLKKLYKELPVDSVFWFLKCWLGSEDSRADPNSCVISRGDAKGRMRRIDGGKGSDKVWRLDTIVGMLYHGLPMSSTDTNIMVHTCDQELCVRPQHIRFRASSVALVVVLKALAQAGYTLVPPRIPAGISGVAPNASDESVDVFGPFSIDELQQYRSEELRPATESYSKLTLSASDRELANSVLVLRRAVDGECEEDSAKRSAAEYFSSIPGDDTKSDVSVYPTPMNGLKAEPSFNGTSSTCDNQPQPLRVISPRVLFSATHVLPEGSLSSLSACLTNGSVSELQSTIRSSTSPPTLPTSLFAPTNVSQSTPHSSSSTTANSSNFYPAILQTSMASSVTNGNPRHFFSSAPQPQECTTVTTTTTLHRPLPHHQRYSLKRPAPRDSPPNTSQSAVPTFSSHVSLTNSQGCLLTQGRSTASEKSFRMASSSPPLLISEVTSNAHEHNSPQFTRHRPPVSEHIAMAESGTATIEAQSVISQNCAPLLPCQFDTPPCVSSPGQGMLPSSLLLRPPGESQCGIATPSFDSVPSTTTALLTSHLLVTDRASTPALNGCFISATGDVVRPLPFPGSSGSGKNTPRQPPKKRLEARTPTIEAVGDDEIISGSSLLLPNLEEISCPIAECSTLGISSTSGSNGSNSAFRVHQNTPFMPVLSRSGRPSSTGSGSNSTTSAPSSSSTSQSGCHINHGNQAPIRGVKDAVQEEESEMDQELVDIMTYGRESIAGHHFQLPISGSNANPPQLSSQQRTFEALMASLAGCRYASPAFGCQTPVNPRRSSSACSLPRVGASPNEDLSELNLMSSSASQLLLTGRGLALSSSTPMVTVSGIIHDVKAVGRNTLSNGISRDRHFPHRSSVLQQSSLTPPPQLLSNPSSVCVTSVNSNQSHPESTATGCIQCGGGAGSLVADFGVGQDLANVVRQSPASGISQDLIEMLYNMAQQYGMHQPRAGSRASRPSSQVAQRFYRSLVNGSACASPFLPATIVAFNPSSTTAFDTPVGNNPLFSLPVNTTTSSNSDPAIVTNSISPPALMTQTSTDFKSLSQQCGAEPAFSARFQTATAPKGALSCTSFDFDLTRTSGPSMVNCHRSTAQ